MQTNRPVLAIVLAGVASGLILLDAGVLLSDGHLLNLVEPGLGNFSVLYGEGEAAAGFTLVALGAVLAIWPRTHFFVGAAMIVVSLLSWPGGGGFEVGTVVGMAAGVLAILFVVKYYPDPSTYLPPFRPLASPARPPSSSGASPEGPAEGSSVSGPSIGP